MVMAPANTGSDSNSRNTVTSTDHTNNGILCIVMPGAREFISVVMKLIPPSKKATNSSATATSQSVEPSGVKL